MNGDKEITERLDRIESQLAGGQAGGQRWTGYEYRSRLSFGSIPFLHVAYGFDPRTGRMRVAKGIIAIGQVAFGLLAIGGVAFGGLSLGGVAVGLLALAGVSVGAFFALGGLAISPYIAIGGLAIAGHIAAGGMAVSWNYAFGGFAIGKHPYGSNIKDPQALEFLRSLFPDWKW